MKKLALTAVGLLIAGSASAADLRTRPIPSKAPAPVAVSYNWTGCYVGAGGGYGMFKQETRFAGQGNPQGVPVDNGGDGWFGTVQVGCDYQVSSNIVIGAFADYDWSGIKGTMSTGMFNMVGEEKLKNSWAAGGRLGYLPFNQLLVYVSGGYTQSQFDQVSLGLAIGGPAQFLLDKHTYSGWFIGTGYEYGLGWMPGLYWKTEYRFADLSADNVRILQTTGAPTADYMNTGKNVHTVRSELVWRFNFGGPVVARY